MCTDYITDFITPKLQGMYSFCIWNVSWIPGRWSWAEVTAPFSIISHHSTHLAPKTDLTLNLRMYVKRARWEGGKILKDNYQFVQYSNAHRSRALPHVGKPSKSLSHYFSPAMTHMSRKVLVSSVTVTQIQAFQYGIDQLPKTHREHHNLLDI